MTSLAVKTLLSCLLVYVVQLSIAEADKHTYWYQNDYPNPRKEPERCGRETKKPSWLCDPDNFLTKNETMRVDKIIASVRTKTRCTCYKCVNKDKGYLIMVAMMGKMYRKAPNHNDSETQLFKDSQKFARKLMRRWGGRSMCNESVLILFSKDDNMLYTVTESNAGKVLNDSMVLRVQDSAKWYFALDDHIGEGLIMMLEDYRDIFMKKYRERPVPSFAHNSVHPAQQQEDSKTNPTNSAVQNNIRYFVPNILLVGSILSLSMGAMLI
ncbi:uncharacterized protein LOC115221659 [Argonauta hians]